MRSSPDRYQQLREQMVESQIARRGIVDLRVLQAMREVPRHRFVPQHLHASAYADSALPIGEGQTISQPYIVALMTAALDLGGEEQVLEIGTGSGYQAAVLSKLAKTVYTIERHTVLAQQAGAIFEELGYSNVHVRVADGTSGWPESAPFQAIMITAAAPEVPRPLIDQLADGGLLVAPVGPAGLQKLVLVRKEGDRSTTSQLAPVVFVPLIGEHGWSDEDQGGWGWRFWRR
ncbi:MAG TPA: protein-L-isoaspartate(D-aspartate) O-methyltransferase [Anaerolineae bacterium]|nr:protein-L-isoaspartate(D-aspartate) O-methyltransferase [Anaerolineae bacterium]